MASTAIHLHLLHSQRLRPPQTQTPNSKIQNPNGPFGFWILDFGFWSILDFGFWILDFGFWILDFGFWILDYCIWEFVKKSGGKYSRYSKTLLRHPQINLSYWKLVFGHVFGHGMCLRFHMLKTCESNEIWSNFYFDFWEKSWWHETCFLSLFRGHFRMAFESFCCQGEFVCSLVWILWCKRFLLWRFRDTTNRKQIRVPVVNLIGPCSAIWIRNRSTLQSQNTQWHPKRQSYAVFAWHSSLHCWPVICCLQVTKLPSLQHCKKWKTNWLRQDLRWFCGMFSDVFGLLWFYSKLKLSEANFSFFRARKPIIWGFNRSEGCDSFFLRKAPACSRIMSARQNFPSWRSWMLERGTFTLLQGRLPKRPKRMLQLQHCKLWKFIHRLNRQWLRLHFHPVRPGTFAVGLNAKHAMKNSKGNFLGPKRPISIAYAKEAMRNWRWSKIKRNTLQSLWLARRKDSWEQHTCCKSLSVNSPKAQGQRWAWCWTDWHQSPTNHCNGFVSPKENDGMRGTAFDVGFSLKAISMHLLYMSKFYIMSTAWIFLTCVLTTLLPGCWEHVVIEVQSGCFGCRRKFSSFLSRCMTVCVWKPFVLGCFRMFCFCGVAVAMHVRENNKRARTRFLRGVHDPTSFAIVFAKPFAQKLHVDRSHLCILVQHHTICWNFHFKVLWYSVWSRQL